MNDRQRVNAAAAIACAGLLAAMAISPRLWISARTYPLTPVPPLPVLPVWIGTAAAGATAAALFGALFALLWRTKAPSRAAGWDRAQRRTLAATLGGVVLLAASDQSRWQPWYFQYVALIAVVAAAISRVPKRFNHSDALSACRCMIAGTYLWSGLQKFNVSFVRLDFPWMVEPLVAWLPPAMVAPIASAGLIVPLVEVSMAFGLVFARSARVRRLAVTAAIGTHLFILLCLGPLGHDWNVIVWPWNVAMIAFLILLFRSVEQPDWQAVLLPRGRPVNAIVIVLFWIVPALSLFDLWDSYLSASLYSRNTRKADIDVSAAVARRLPEAIRAHLDDDGWLWLMGWSLAELNVPIYPEPRIFKSLGRAVCLYAASPDEVLLTIASRPDAFSGERSFTTFDCSEM